MRVPYSGTLACRAQAIDCRFSQISGSVEATGRESKNEIRFCEYARSRTPESDDRACAEAAIARKRSSVYWPSRCRTHRSCSEFEFRTLLRKEYPLGSVAKGYAPLAKLHGLDVVEHSARKIHPGRCKSALDSGDGRRGNDN
jgi:hypothetical protein